MSDYRNPEIEQILKQEASAILSIPVSEQYVHVVELIHRKVHGEGGKIITSGMGKAGQVAHNIATTFSSTGTPAVFLHPSEAQHGDLGILSEHDILLVLSNSGKTREIIELVDLTRALYDRIPLVVFTGNPGGELPRKAAHTLYTGNPSEVCPLGLTPTTSSTTMAVMGDVLVVLMMKKIGFTSLDYAKRHHGGYLGEKSREKHHENT